MARRRKTDPGKATLARVMGEMGFGVALISQIADLPRQTVNDIVQGRGIWRELPRNELYATLRERLITNLENCAGTLAMQAMTKLEQKMETASYIELIGIFDVTSNLALKGGQADER
ncbi:MAG: hypothetical protein ACE5JU_22940 [Candidatus Binatia bacterium]